jgi:hypothetical protein
MSNEMREYDALVREKLKEKKVTPPPAVWENIQKKRSFGHKVAVKIASNWRTFGTLVLLAFLGSSTLFFAEPKQVDTSNHFISKQFDQHNSTYNAIVEVQNNFISEPFIQSKTVEENNAINQDNSSLPDFSMVASEYGSGFGKPFNFDYHVSSLIEQIDNWENGKSASAIRFVKIDYAPGLGIQPTVVVKSAALPSEDYDYVIPQAEKKSFWERSSLILSLTPQTINKTISPGFSLSTEEIMKRKASEKTRLAYSLGANFRYELKNHQFVESGIMYTSIYEEVHLEGEKQFSNNYNFIEIPLLFGYQDREAKWGWFIKGGLGIQLLNLYDGYIFKQETIEEIAINETQGPLYRMSATNALNGIINPDHQLKNEQIRDEVYDLSTDENPYKTAGVINLHLATGLIYYCGEKTSLFASPYYRRNINSISKSDALFREHISLMGISFGTQVKF